MQEQATHLKFYVTLLAKQFKSESDRPNDSIMSEKEVDKKTCVYEAGVITVNFLMKSFIKCQICETEVQAFSKIGLQYGKIFIFRITWSKAVPRGRNGKIEIYISPCRISLK